MREKVGINEYSFILKATCFSSVIVTIFRKEQEVEKEVVDSGKVK